VGAPGGAARARLAPARAVRAEVDELVDLYQRVATHLSVVQSIGATRRWSARLSSLVARARGVVAGGRRAAWATSARFLQPTSRRSCYRTAGGGSARPPCFLVVAFAYGSWIATSPRRSSPWRRRRW
jgi:hypothetical protein